MKVSVFGLGYVGTISAGCLANDGHEVVGVDPIQTKVDLINQGHTPIIEQEIGEIIAANVKSGRLRAVVDPVEAVQKTNLSFVCVGTPSQSNGNLDLRFIRRICEQIGDALKRKSSKHTVVIRSTVLPGTMRDIVIPILREGSAVRDFYGPPKTVIGELDRPSGCLLAQLYEKLDAPLIRTSVETAEMVKYVDNCWHALKIGFAN